VTSFFDHLQKTSFFEQNWRRKPQFISDACCIDPVTTCVTRQKLLNLATEDLVESRLVDTTDYSVAFGPFDLEAVPATGLLMIQGLDQHLPVIDDLLGALFSFLPRWRIEDVMATLGPTGTHCGAHFDHYDVFLIQIAGTKNWALDEGGHTDFELNPDVDIRLLGEFNSTSQYTASPGDILYIPPGVGHWGIAEGESITLSVGLRNPTMEELISHLADTVGDSITLKTVLNQVLNPGKDGIPTAGIPTEDIETLASELAGVLLNPERLADWFGGYMTEPKEPELIPDGQTLSMDALAGLLTGDHELSCALPTRLTYHQSDAAFTVYVNGNALTSHVNVQPWLRDLCRMRHIATRNVSRDRHSTELIHYLLACGAIQINPVAQAV